MSSEKDYSDYIQHLSTQVTMLSLFAGFVLTMITILLTQLPDPSNPIAQIMLFVLTYSLYALSFVLTSSALRIIYYCRKVPPLTRDIAMVNYLSWSTLFLLTGSLVLLYAIWSLVYLALAAAITAAVFAGLSWKYLLQPFRRNRKTLPGTE